MSQTTLSPVRIGLVTAAFMAIANMIGTGIFTSLGFQVADIRSTFPVLMLWVVGGVVALCGALTYGELGAALPRSGGEYNLVQRIYHPSLGFLAGWVSITVGFSAPTALAAMALATYVHSVFPAVPVVHLGAAVVVFFTILHSTTVRGGLAFNNVLTVLKIGLLFFFAGAAFAVESPESVNLLPRAGDWELITSGYFAVSLIYVAYAYTGWNAAIYIVGEMKDPGRHLAKALFAGTLVVLVLYTLVNFVFLYSVPMDELAGQIEVGYLSGTKIFGEVGGSVMAIIIAMVLTSTVSVMIYIGPRIMQVMGEDLPLLKKLAVKNAKGIPLNGMLLQVVITLGFIYTSTFQQVLLYAGFTLALVSTVAVAGIFVLRFKQPDLERPYRTWGYPVTPLIFLAVSLWSLVFMVINQPWESFAGLVTLATGLVIYLINYLVAGRYPA